jgi:Flp pilus assembly protein TadD
MRRLLILTTLAVGGCASTQDRSEKPWLALPSPWATVKSSPASGALGSSTKDAPKPNAYDESLTMALLRGRNLERSGDWTKARMLYEDLRKKHPDSIEVVHRLGVVADSQRRHDEAEQLFLLALAREPRHAALLSDLGYCYFLQGQLSKAQSALLKATVLEPSNPRHWNNLGLVTGHMGRHEQALGHFRKAGSEADALYNLAFIFAAQDRADEAKQCFQEALAADPTHRRAREALVSFEEYERMPAHMRDFDIADGGVRYVPYFETGDGDSGVRTADGFASSSRDASQATRALYTQSRGMLNRNMQSQRSDEAGK